MGLEIDRDHFEEGDYPPFRQRLDAGLDALRQLLERPGFGEGPPSLGVELELTLVDRLGRPLPLNQAVRRESRDPRVTLELNRFNLECNLRPTPLAGRPFEALRGELADALAVVRQAADVHGAGVVMIGILPTLRAGDLQCSAMSDSMRFRALSAALAKRRRELIRLQISGAEPLEMICDDVTFEGAASSMQVHLRVEPTGFARTYNAAQLATAPVLAAACNSPTLLDHRLWEETRIALFMQAVDDRDRRARRRGMPARVSFGSSWVQSGALELFEKNVSLHAPLLPVVGSEDPISCVEGGGVPELDELRLHHGTVWHWNRAIYSPAENGHLRIEMRALPAGPSPSDMIANSAFLVGLVLGMAPDAERWIRTMPFEQAEHNFYRAAREGLSARLLWSPAPGEAPVEVGARELVLELLPLARRGLDRARVDPQESEEQLAVIEARVRQSRTGAAWQRLALGALEPRLGRREALAALLEDYRRHSDGDQPVHSWPLAVG